jgi:acetaldehyde dehydrogenase
MRREMSKVKVAIIGSGNIGTDLMIKVMRQSRHLEMGVMVGVDPDSDGLARARRMGVATTHEGLEGLMRMPEWKDIRVVFDATSAYAHKKHSEICVAAGKQVIDLTPAAIGPFTVPSVNLDDHLDEANVNMVTCGGQATIPIVASISSKSAGPGTRANIDEFTETTSRAIERVGGVERGKAIIVLNPAEPPLMMRDTVFALAEGAEPAEVEDSVAAMVKDVQSYVPGYRLKQTVQFERIGDNDPLTIPGQGTFTGLKVAVLLEVEGAAHYLPAYAGNLDIMTSAAMATADRWVERKLNA